MTTKLIFLNGPPNSGKDTLGKALPYPEYSLATPLREASFALFGGDPDSYDEDKEKPLAPTGMSRRDVMIWLSEECMKPQFGDHIFGQLMAEKLRRAEQYKRNVLSLGPSHDGLAVLMDCGFVEETEYLVNEFGVKNCMIIHIHREGCNFDNDSRNYVKPLRGMKYLSVVNDDTVADMVNFVNWHIQGFIHQWQK